MKNLPNTGIATGDGESVATDAQKALTLKITPKHEMVGVDHEMQSQIICTTLQARDLPEEQDRAPVDVIVALDVSGSMQGSKLELCKTTLKLLLRVLGSKDRMGLVTYADDARLDFPPLFMTEENKRVCVGKIETLRATTCTNISGGLGLAVQEMRSIESPNEVQHVFLLTDGLANRGICSYSDLVEFTKNCFAGDNGDSMSDEPYNTPIGLSCFGYGTDHNGRLLQAMASSIMGSYYFVQNDSDVGGAFGDALGGILSVVAQSTVLTIEVSPEAQAMGAGIVKVYHDSAINRGNGVYTVTLGDFYAEESRDVLVEMKLARPSQTMGNMEGEAPIGHLTVSVSFVDTLSRAPDKLEPVVGGQVYRPWNSRELSPADPHVAAQRLRVLAAQEIKAANELASQNNLEGARERFRSLNRELDECQDLPADDEFKAQLKRDALNMESQLRSQSQYVRVGSKMMANQAHEHMFQRSMEACAPDGSTNLSAGDKFYSSSKKRSMARFFNLGGSKK